MVKRRLQIYSLLLVMIIAPGVTFAALTRAEGQADRVAESIARALRILDEMDRLLAGIEARQKPESESVAVVDPSIAPLNQWVDLFDGRTLGGWKITEFGGAGEVKIVPAFRGGQSAIIVNGGVMLSGFNWTKKVPRTNYEIELEAMKIDGFDFLCGLTFPVGESHASLIVGGWGGGVVGISSIDNRDASENDTTKILAFPKDRWYAIRLRVTPEKLIAWLDGKQVIEQEITGRKISLRPGEISRSIPLGFSTFQTTAAFRGIKMRRLGIEKK